MSVFLNGLGGINHVINNQGEAVSGPKFMIKFVCEYNGNQAVGFLEE